jgi:cytochrome P450
VDVDVAMMRVTLDVVARALFSADLAFGADRITAAVLGALDVVVGRARSLIRWPMAVPTPANLRMRRAVSVIDESVEALIAQRRRRPAGRADLLDAYLTTEVDGTRMTDTQVRDEVVTLLVAGHETVASSLTWTSLLLAQHPKAQERLHGEVDLVVGARPPAYADLASLPWTGQVVEEALRLYPPAWVITRRANADDVVLGHRVPAGALVILCPWVTQRDGQWWDQPQAFRPERFAPAERASQVRGTYFPFGAGPTLCIGRDFALVESVLLLATIAQRYAFEELPGQVVQPDPLVTIRPRGGLPLRLRRR